MCLQKAKEYSQNISMFPTVKHGDCFMVLWGCVVASGTEWFNKCTAWWNQKNTKDALERNVESSDRKLRHNGREHKHKWRDLRTVLGLKYLYILYLFSNKEPGTWQVVQNSEFKNWLPFNWVWIWIELAALYRKLNWKTGRGMYCITIYRDLTQVMQYFSTLNCPST